MKAKTFLISYQPYSNRDERCTIGALVFDNDDKARLHLAFNLRKIRAIDPSCNISAVRDNLRDITDSINESSITWAAFKSGFGAIRFSEAPGFFLYRDLVGYDKQVNTLLALMVEPNKVTNIKERRLNSGLFLELKRTFDQYGWLAKEVNEIDDHKVVAQYPISVKEQLFAEFALKNGKLHIVETIDFRAGIPSVKRLEAQGKALVMDFAKDLNHDTVCTAIVAASDHSEIKASLNVLNKYADRVISVNSSDDMNSFFSEWANLMGRTLPRTPPMHS